MKLEIIIIISTSKTLLHLARFLLMSILGNYFNFFFNYLIMQVAKSAKCPKKFVDCWWLSFPN